MADELTAEDVERLIANEVTAANEETPRMRCLREAQTRHLACLAAAGDNQARRSECNRTLAADIARCPAP